MICDYADQLDIRKLGTKLPDAFLLGRERVETGWTGTNFGGKRQWFLCPACDRRCAILYFQRDPECLRCRICCNGRYLSEHKSPHERKLHKAFKTRKRLGQRKGGIITQFPEKPKFMHWLTYERIRFRALTLEGEIWEQANKFFPPD